MPLPDLHPAVAAWFAQTFDAATPAQARAWPAIRAGRHTLIAAPTGAGKTLAAFLATIDDLVRRGVAGTLTDTTAVVYVSPLKALSNDVRLNLDAPLDGIRAHLDRLGYPDVEIRTAVRTGDTPQSERAAMKRRAPHIVVTTPESLYLLLGSESGRAMLASTRTVIVDEIHALAPNKRGAHLALSLERLEALCGRPPTRIGLSATQKPVEDIARFLCGARDCQIVDIGHARPRDLALELPPAPLAGVMSGEVWQMVYQRLAELIAAHRTTLVFVNTRRLAERLARHLSELLGKDAVTSHHGSLAREQRLAAEQRLKRGELRALVATASLELGIDIGDVDLVCQIASPRSISTFLQRVGRANHSVGGVPKARLFPLSRDDLVECAALLDAVRRGELDALRVACGARDVLAQQIVAEVACREWREDELFALIRRAYPFAAFGIDQYRDIVRMLAEGYTTRQGPGFAHLHRDAVNGVLRGRRGARLIALTCGGAIPDTADYEVVLEPAATRIGTVHEDFAVESMAGDVFQLGNAAYRILRVERGRMRVEDAQGAPPSIPFWIGEAPGRSDELSFAVSRLREEIATRLAHGSAHAALWLRESVGLDAAAAQQIVDYLGAAQAALGLLPTQAHLALERFFDESGGAQLIVHSPFGSRMNRAWGLALRKRFCRTFNFELQAAASEDAIVLSLSTSHSFPLDEVSRYLHSASAEHVLVQALLDAPMFGLRWRWNAVTSLALPRFRGGAKVPPQLQRMRAEDLLAAVFPDQVACFENLVGERQIPDHPLVAQTLYDCLHEAMDVDALLALLRKLESGEVRIAARDLTAPSPLAAEILAARPYAFLDDAPLEERRTQAVRARSFRNYESTEDFARLDENAIAAVREEAWPQARDADELHDALMCLAFLTETDVRANPHWQASLSWLLAARRATRLANLWLPAERLMQFAALYPAAPCAPPLQPPAEYAGVRWSAQDALIEVLRARLSGLGPTTAESLAHDLRLPTSDIEIALLALQREGVAMQGHFDAQATGVQWCDRRLLARIHRYTVERLRREIEPVEPRDFLRFLFDWQHLTPAARVEGPDALAAVLAQLEGYEAPAGAWESRILPARIKGYDITWLDDLCLSGRIAWTRLRAPATRGDAAKSRAAPVQATPIVLAPRRHLALWSALGTTPDEAPAPSSRAQAVVDALREHGASFFDELAAHTHLLHTELEDALAELVATGQIHCDSFAGLRALLTPSSRRPSPYRRGGRRAALFGIADAGRWSLPRQRANPAPADAEMPERIVRLLLRRYGVIGWRLLAREAPWLPPWRELLRACQHLEARGEIRGGRFIAGLSGEQFALPEAIAPLRAVRHRPRDGTSIVVCGADPLNLAGLLTEGAKVPSTTSARVLYRDGEPIAAWFGGKFHAFVTMDEGEAWAARKRLLSGETETAAIA